jgi:hypothetical protein
MQQENWSGLARFVGVRDECISAGLLGRLAARMAELPSEFDDVLVENAKQRKTVRVGVAHRIAPQQPENIPMVEQFNAWVASSGFDGDRGVAGARGWLYSRLTFKIDYIDRVCGITSAQRRKLELAGRGDIKRFCDEVADKRRKLPFIEQSPEKVAEFRLECRRLFASFGNELFEDGSLLSKSIPKTLDLQQLIAFQTALRETTLLQHRAGVDLIVRSLDIAVGLCDQQRQRLTELLLQETTPLPRFGSGGIDLDLELMMREAAEIPAVKFLPICDDFQGRTLNALFTHFREGAARAAGESRSDQAEPIIVSLIDGLAAGSARSAGSCDTRGE